MQKIKLDILGSCISRMILLKGDNSKKGSLSEYINLQYFFDKHNIVTSMMPAPFSRNEVDSIEPDELYDSSRINSLKQELNKDSISMMLNGDADYLLIDLYELTVINCYCNNTIFGNSSYEFFKTKLYDKYKEEIILFNFMEEEASSIYPYIDLFFEKIMNKFDKNHIILNRFHSCKNYLTEDKCIAEIPNAFLKPFHGNYKYNDKLKNLEDYIIRKFDPYVIDLSSYFLVDEENWGNINGVHYQKEFYEEALKKLEDIVTNKNSPKLHDKISSIAVSNILNINLSNDFEFKKYFNEIKKPFVSCQVLDNICKTLNEDEIIENRYLLSKLYKIAEEKNNFLNEDISNNDKVKFILDKLPNEYLNENLIKLILNFYI